MLQPNRTLALGVLALAAACSTRPGGSSEEAAAVVPGVDLVVDGLDTPTSIANSIPIRAHVCNRGDAWAPPSQLDVYASPDADIMPGPPPVGDFLVGNAWVDGISPDSCIDVEVFLWGTPLQGEGRLGAIIDPMSTVFEADEGNNTFVSAPIGFGWGPDLVIRSITVPPTADGAFRATARVCNQGTSDAPGTQLELYASADTTLSLTPPTPDFFIGSGPTEWLPVGGCMSVTIDVFAPPFQGEAYVLGRVDGNNGVPELIESNNLGASGVMGLGYGPELVVASVTMPRVVNGSFAATARVCNQGTAFAPGAQVELFASFDPAFDAPGMFGGGDFPMGNAWVDGLQPGMCQNVALNGFQPPIDGEGFVFARVDGNDTVQELVESNNVFAQGVVGFGSYPDLVIRGITTPPSTNDAFTASLRVCNEGVVPASMAMIEIYASRDGDLEVPMGPGGDFFLGTTQGPAFLREGTCESVSFQGFLPPFQGEGFLIARVDPYEGIAEAIESNNVSVSDGIGFGFGPDLVVRAVDAPTALEPTRAVTVTVCNDGTAPSSFTDVELFASRDTTLDVPPGMAGTPGGDMSVGFAPIVDLMPGACTTAPAQVWGAPFIGEGHLIAEVDRFGRVVELRESNNLRASRLLGFGYGPEVLATTITAPPSASGAFTARVRVCNEGNQSTGSVQVELFASQDRAFDGIGPGGDAFIGSNVGSWLAEGACETVDIAGFAPPWMGEGFLFARVDGGNGIAELIESNNVTAGPQMGFGFGPDLVVEAILAPASIGSSARVEARVCNRGTAPSSSTQLELYASADTTLTTLGPGDFFIGSTSVDPLQEGRCRAVGVDTWAPPLQGEGYLFARVDPYAGVSELIESNNERMSGVIGFGFGPELVARVVSTPTAIGPAGGVVNVDVCNQGTQPAPSAEVRLFGSADVRLDGTPPPAGDFFLGSATTNTLLDVGRCARVSVNVPSVPLQGEGFVLAQIDPSNAILELVESNNVTASARLGFGNGPDLTVTAIQAPPSANGGFNAVLTVCNLGTAPAGGAEVQLVASLDTTFETTPPPAGDLPIAFGQSPTLDAGACAAVTVTGWGGFPGANYLFGRIDPFGVVAELVESNNVTAGPAIGFGNGPDLVVEQLITPTNVGPNSAIDAIVCNVGQSWSSSAQVALYASRDATFEPGFFGPEGDLPVGFANVDPLDAGRCRPVRFTSIPTPPWSNGYLFARVDEPSSVEELIEFNNERASGLVGFGFGVDLVVTALSAPAAVNGTFTTQVTICNRGTDPSPSTSVELYASADVTIEPGPGGDPFVGSTTVPTLATNACVTRPVSGAAPLFGEARLAAIVDQANVVMELLEGNNSFVGAVMGFGAGPELVARTVTVPLSASGSFNVTVQVCNQGTSASSSTQVEVFASRDVALATPGDAFLGSAPVNALTPGQCQAVQLSAPIPPFEGEVFVLARVDAFNAVLELVESNNVTASAAMTAGFGVDLELRTLDADPFVRPGGMLAVRWTVCNIGATGSGGTDLSLSSFDGPSPDPRFARWTGFSVWVSPLAAGACTSGTETVPGPVFEGQGWVVGTLDPFGSTTQLRRSNDSRSDGVVVATSYCGDGIVDAGERCDDSNFSSNDGCSATCQIETRQVWQSIANGTQRTNIAWNYAMGYHFTPTQNGFITRLGGLFNGTKTVRLFDRTTGAVLATAQVTSANGWSYVDIPAVPVQANRSYTVAVYLAGSGGSQRTGITALPRTSGDVRVDGSTFALTTTNPTARPTNVVTTVMYGQADVVFSRYR